MASITLDFDQFLTDDLEDGSDEIIALSIEDMDNDFLSLFDQEDEKELTESDICSLLDDLLAE